MFAPLRVVQAGSFLRLRVKRLSFEVALASATDWVRWRAHIDGAPPQDLPEWQEVSRGLDAWKPVTVSLPPGGAAILRVDVRAKPHKEAHRNQPAALCARGEARPAVNDDLKAQIVAARSAEIAHAAEQLKNTIPTTPQPGSSGSSGDGAARSDAAGRDGL